MTAKKCISALFAIALILSVVPLAFAEETGDQNSSLETPTLDGSEESNSSTIDQKLVDQSKEFYDTMLDFFSKNQDSNMSTVVIIPAPGDTNSTGGDGNSTPVDDTNNSATDVNASFGLDKIQIGDLGFYLGQNEDGYYFGDVNGSVYFIQKEDLPISVSVHLSKLLPTMDKILLALEQGDTGRAYGLLNSLESRITASARFIEKRGEQEQKKLEIQERKQNRINERIGDSNASTNDIVSTNNSNKEDKSNNGKGNSGSNNGNSGNGNGGKK